MNAMRDKHEERSYRVEGREGKMPVNSARLKLRLVQNAAEGKTGKPPTTIVELEGKQLLIW